MNKDKNRFIVFLKTDKIIASSYTVGRPQCKVNSVKKTQTHPRLHHTETRAKIRRPKTVNSE
jgi:hypothetical protein